jgi:hypothetical protein
MWILFDGGFVSIVQKRGSVDLCVRARRREDLKQFLEHARSRIRIRETLDADYRFRVVCSKSVVAAAMLRITGAIDYDNFKSRIAEKDRPRAHLYSDVWSTLYELQEPKLHPAWPK